nr:hypothetical protein Itr_chr03CG03540 [Ipomoea trifida]
MTGAILVRKLGGKVGLCNINTGELEEGNIISSPKAIQNLVFRRKFLLSDEFLGGEFWWVVRNWFGGEVFLFSSNSRRG